MRYTRVIWRIGLEADGEDVIAIISGNVKMLGTCLVVLQVQGCQLKLRNMLAPEKSEAVKLLTSLGILGDLCHSSLGRVDSASQHC